MIIFSGFLPPEHNAQPSQPDAEKERTDRPYHGYHTQPEYHSTYSKKNASPFGKKAGAGGGDSENYEAEGPEKAA